MTQIDEIFLVDECNNQMNPHDMKMIFSNGILFRVLFNPLKFTIIPLRTNVEGKICFSN
jgi:hypothetical protein